MPKQREIPWTWADDYEYADAGEQAFVYIGHAETRADTDYQALMETPPGYEPDVSRAERLELRDLIVDAIDGLTEQEKWIFDALFVRRLSLRQLAAEIQMPKTTVARWRDRLLLRVRSKLEHEPMIIEYLEGSR